MTLKHSHIKYWLYRPFFHFSSWRYCTPSRRPVARKVTYGRNKKNNNPTLLCKTAKLSLKKKDTIIILLLPIFAFIHIDSGLSTLQIMMAIILLRTYTFYCTFDHWHVTWSCFLYASWSSRCTCLIYRVRMRETHNIHDHWQWYTFF